MNYYELIVPDAYIPYIEYGDWDGLLETEKQEIDQVIKGLRLQYVEPVGFRIRNSFNNMGAYCSLYKGYQI